MNQPRAEMDAFSDVTQACWNKLKFTAILVLLSSDNDVLLAIWPDSIAYCITTSKI